MSNMRRSQGEEVASRLRDWTSGQTAAERLSAQILLLDGYRSVNPAHPLGGQDGLKDVTCTKDGVEYVGAAYFPNGDQPFRDVKAKFRDDLRGVATNQVGGFAFRTNQYLTLSQRSELESHDKSVSMEIYHRERLATLLNSPLGYGVRLDFLQIAMTLEEQVSYFRVRDEQLLEMNAKIDRLAEFLSTVNVGGGLSVTQAETFRQLLYEMVGPQISLIGTAPIDRLKVPLFEIQEFKRVLEELVGSGLLPLWPATITRLRIPLKELREFDALLKHIVGYGLIADPLSPITRLRVPLNELQEYESTLDRVIAKQREVKRSD
jgi:hypothetical protein